MITLRPKDTERIRACRAWAEAETRHRDTSFFHATSPERPPVEHVVVLLPEGYVCVYEVQRAVDAVGPLAHLAVNRRRHGITVNPTDSDAVTVAKAFGFGDGHLATPGQRVLHFFAPLLSLTPRS